MPAERLLLWFVRINAGVLLLAAPCALLPFVWMETIHSDLLGMGTLPDVLISKYMARSLCLVYALHGAVILCVLKDWPRYRPLVPVLARLHILYGGLMVLLDWATGMPWWWIGIEGPGIATYGILLLTVFYRANRVK